MSALAELIAAIDAAADPETAAVLARYFKTKPGEYGEGDQMIGVKLSTLRALIKPYLRAGLPLPELEKALASPVHEHRLAVLALLADRATLALKPRTADPAESRAIFELYLRNTRFVNNWDLVDCSAPQIVGGHLKDKPRDLLRTLVVSPSLWERRIALIATQWFINTGESADTYELAARVLSDREDLIHKAAGWMLREAGKRVDQAELEAFLDTYAERMPRTMLRYSIERLPPETRAYYLAKRKKG
ncbi:DNA alkylation repair protein [Kribbella sp. NBC_01245]|uniref:DNA alkylation repair protein n=1 Tax=Kribbella sp. NBC_01245 TaxID=2903578 RepID=UPI002E2D9207|nr:DNA alkylation repair protein [Kribbella sp. NBC_01245]